MEGMATGLKTMVIHYDDSIPQDFNHPLCGKICLEKVLAEVVTPLRETDEATEKFLKAPRIAMVVRKSIGHFIVMLATIRRTEFMATPEVFFDVPEWWLFFEVPHNALLLKNLRHLKAAGIDSHGKYVSGYLLQRFNDQTIKVLDRHGFGLENFYVTGQLRRGVFAESFWLYVYGASIATAVLILEKFSILTVIFTIFFRYFKNM